MEDLETDFNIIIVSCYSQSHQDLNDDENEPAVGSESEHEGLKSIKTLESDIDTLNLINENDENKDKIRELDTKDEEIVKDAICENLQEDISDSIKLHTDISSEKEDISEKVNEETKSEELNLVTHRPPHLPEWLRSGADRNDELLVAYINRPDPMKIFMCSFCYDWFNEQNELNEHIFYKHAKNKPKFQKCRKCGAKFMARILRIRHEKLHKYDLKYPHFMYTSPTDNIWDFQVKNHFIKRFRPAPLSEWYYSHLNELCDEVQELSYECCDCGTGFPDEESVRKHYELIHALQQCGYCGKICRTWGVLRQHEKEYHGKYNIHENYIGGAWDLWDHWICEESLEKEEIVSNVAYFHNYRKRSSDEPVIFEEDYVEKNIQALPRKPTIVHKKSKSGIINKSEASSTTDLEADKTKEDFSTDEIMTDHLDENEDIIFLNERNIKQEATNLLEYHSSLPFKCESCPKSYDNEHDLKRHARCHQQNLSGERQQTLACQFCDKTFKTHSHKKEHERIHTGEKPYVCPICSRSFIQSSNLKKHIQTHKSQNTLQCGICGKQFIKETSLALHQRAHAQDRKFRCEICDRAYNYASLLKRHMRIHTGEMPYSCELCGMLFHELVSLHYHRKKVHTGERPHRCDTCGRAFILSSDLKKHVQIHLKPPSDRVVSKTSRRRSQCKSQDSEGLENNGFLDKFDSCEDGLEIQNSQEENEMFFTSKDPALGSIKEIDDDHHEMRSENDLENNESPIKTASEDIVVIEKQTLNKPPILRVYKRRDIKPRTDGQLGNSPCKNISDVQIETLSKTPNQEILETIVPENYIDNSIKTKLPQDLNEEIQNEKHADKLDPDVQRTMITNHSDLQNYEILEIEEDKIKILTETESNNQEEISQAGTLANISSEMLREQFGTDFEMTTETTENSIKMFQVSDLEMVPTCSDDIDHSAESEIGPQTIDDVLHMSGIGSFSELEINSIVVVPSETNSRTDGQLGNSQSKNIAEVQIETLSKTTNQEILETIATESYVDNSIKNKLPPDLNENIENEKHADKLDPDVHVTLIPNHSDLQNCEILEIEDKIKILTETESNNQEEISQAGTLANISSEMLREQFGTDFEMTTETTENQIKMFQVSDLEMVPTCSDDINHSEAESEIGPQTIDDVLHMSDIGSFGELDIYSIVVVPPDISSEIEIILDGS